MVEIMSPRPFFDSDAEPNGRDVMKLGTESSGMTLTATVAGIEINGYYQGFKPGTPLYAISSLPMKISWEDLDKIKEGTEKRKSKKKSLKPTIDEIVDEDYLNALPQVSINNIKYYIDVDRQERRPVSDPAKVYKYQRKR